MEEAMNLYKVYAGGKHYFVHAINEHVVLEWVKFHIGVECDIVTKQKAFVKGRIWKDDSDGYKY